MKKFKIIFATVMLGIATVGGFQAYEYANMSAVETILLENVEALATTNESDGSIQYHVTDTIKCSCGGTRVICISGAGWCKAQKCEQGHGG